MFNIVDITVIDTIRCWNPNVFIHFHYILFLLTMMNEVVYRPNFCLWLTRTMWFIFEFNNLSTWNRWWLMHCVLRGIQQIMSSTGVKGILMQCNQTFLIKNGQVNILSQWLWWLFSLFKVLSSYIAYSGSSDILIRHKKKKKKYGHMASKIRP